MERIKYRPRGKQGSAMYTPYWLLALILLRAPTSVKSSVSLSMELHYSRLSNCHGRPNAIPVTANSVEALLVYYILAGTPWGIWQTCTCYSPCKAKARRTLTRIPSVTIIYASEVCPLPLRGYLTTDVNFCWGNWSSYWSGSCQVSARTRIGLGHPLALGVAVDVSTLDVPLS